ncbi:MAG: LemA family protein [Bacilli bacterium]|nr:LemA family protein [Bacilli bacterium]
MILASSTVIIIIAAVGVVLLFAIVAVYNGLVKMRNKVRNAWSQIDVQLKRRFDMIPNLVETVKGYAKHESGIFEEFAKARNMYSQAAQQNNVEGMAKANDALGGTLSRLLAVREAYPELKANTHFQALMGDLKDTEDKIAYSRQFYNDIVHKFNDFREVFPRVIFAKMFGFKSAAFFEVMQEERQNVKVSF